MRKKKVFITYVLVLSIVLTVQAISFARAAVQENLVLSEEGINTDQGILISTEISSMYLVPSSKGLDYAIYDPDGGSQPSGKLVRVKPDELAGYRVDIFGSISQLPFDFGIRYSSLNDDWHSFSGAGGTDSLWHTRMHPDSVISRDITSAYATYSLDYKVLDFEVSKSFQITKKIDASLSGGIRYARLENEFNVQYIDGVESAVFCQNNDTRGIGPFIGLEGGWKLPHGFRLNGMLNLALLYSNTDYDKSDDVSSLSTEFQDELLPILSYRLGVDWQKNLEKNYKLKAGLGYEVQYWMSASHENRYIDDVDESLFTHTQNDLVLHGLVATIGLEKRF